MAATPVDGLDFWSFVDYAVARVAQEHPQTDVRAHRVVLGLYRAVNLVVYDLEASVHRPRGLTWPGFRVLFVLWLAGPLEGKRVAELAGMSRAAVSGLAKTLARDGLLTREPDTGDRRVVRLRLTGAGHDRIQKLFTAQHARERLWAGALSPGEQEQLVALLDKLIRHSAVAQVRRRL